jgi:lipid II isoglutaminyl synthase (glutamine-hydrolysing)
VDPRLSTALAAGKFAGLLSRSLGAGGGTTLPGELASRIDPGMLTKLTGKLPRGCTVVTGTNGKTTTSRLLSNILSAAGWHPVHNRAGANLLNGVTSALIGQTGLQGDVEADCGLFEVDEAVMPDALARLKPNVVVVTNLFRDQLDRYGEVNFLTEMWRNAVASLPADATVVLNADDSAVSSLGQGIKARVIYYGVDDLCLGQVRPDHAADSIYCYECGAEYKYSAIYYGHIGIWSCPVCGSHRPALDMAAELVLLDGLSGSTFQVISPSGRYPVSIHLPGLYNVYNALAAGAAATALGVSYPQIQQGVQASAAAFGRIEKIPVEGKDMVLALVKNPVGCNQVLRTIFGSEGEEGRKTAVIIINDNLADGTDISWLWDADFEQLNGKIRRVIVGGTRAEDMLLRLKYAGLDPKLTRIIKAPESALKAGLTATPPGDTVYVLPTYTALLETRKVLNSWGSTAGFWEG